jgi:hypothetical protein
VPAATPKAALAPSGPRAPGLGATQPQALRAPGSGKMQLLVSVDWEGADLREENMTVFEELRTRFPQVRLVHFLNAGYYTRAPSKPAEITATIRRVLRPGDELGLHLHGWRRLVEAAGVPFRTSPRFSSAPPLVPDSPDCAYDCGIDVPVSAYTAPELRKIIKLSIDTLERQGFGRAKSFRTGGWMARPHVLEAVAAEGITHDHSDVATGLLASKLMTSPIWDWLKELWPKTTDTSQPYLLPTPAGTLVEVPDNGALAGYTSGGQMLDVYEHNKQAYLRDTSRNIVLSFGFHEEVAKRDLPDLMRGLQYVIDAARADGIPLESVTNEAISAQGLAPR